jgi:hypothetical protein
MTESLIAPIDEEIGTFCVDIVRPRRFFELVTNRLQQVVIPEPDDLVLPP